MQLLLKADIEHLGRRGDIVTVKNGYGRNYLLPQNKAIAMTQRNLKQIERAKATILKEEAEKRARLEELAKMLSAVSCNLLCRTTDEGHLYGSVGPREVVASLAEAGHTIAEDEIDLVEHIKEVGLYMVPITLHQGVAAEVKVWVLPEKEKPSSEEEAPD